MKVIKIIMNRIKHIFKRDLTRFKLKGDKTYSSYDY